MRRAARPVQARRQATGCPVSAIARPRRGGRHVADAVSVKDPVLAGTGAPSSLTRLQSIRAIASSRSSRTRCMPVQTPAFCQSRRRRQQLMPEPQPISAGSISQGRPELRTDRMPVNAARSPMGGRPPFGRGRGGGTSEAISFQRSSVRRDEPGQTDVKNDVSRRSVRHPESGSSNGRHGTMAQLDPKDSTESMSTSCCKNTDSSSLMINPRPINGGSNSRQSDRPNEASSFRSQHSEASDPGAVHVAAETGDRPRQDRAIFTCTGDVRPEPGQQSSRPETQPIRVGVATKEPFDILDHPAVATV